MAFTIKGKNGKTYTLHQSKKNANLKYFAAKKSAAGKPIDKPAGYKVVTNTATGLPMLKKK